MPQAVAVRRVSLLSSARFMHRKVAAASVIFPQMYRSPAVNPVNSSSLIARYFSAPKVEDPMPAPKQPKVEEPVPSQKQAKAPIPEKGWVTFMKSHSEEFLNILLASILLIVSLRMLREKGEKLEEKKSTEHEIESLRKELNKIKSELTSFVETDLPKIITASNPKGAKIEFVTSQVAEKIRSIVTPKPVSSNQPIEEQPVPTMQSTVQRGLI
jgi:hypothetical protein